MIKYLTKLLKKFVSQFEDILHHGVADMVLSMETEYMSGTFNIYSDHERDRVRFGPLASECHSEHCPF